MTRTTSFRPARVLALLGAAIALLTPSLAAQAEPTSAERTTALALAPTARINGNGSSWAGNALADWVAAVKAQGVTVDYTPDGSSSGRKNFAQGLSDFAVSEIPYTGDTSDPQDTLKPTFSYAMLPVVAGGTSFMYNLPIGGKRYTDLKLSQAALAKIFSGQITRWNDPLIKKTNPTAALPDQRITVVVRSDGSGATAQFTLWMLREFPRDYAALCAKTGCNPKSATSYFPYQGLSNFTAQSQSNGVTTYTANTPYTINYDEYSYPLGVNFPVAQVQNAAGFFTIPTDNAVAVALTQAKINQDKGSANYLSQDLSKVYAYKDPRTYPISAYSYLIVPTETRGNFTKEKGATLAYFGAFSACEGQRTMGALGYSPLPMNLVLAGMDQLERIPGIDAATKKVIADTKAGVKSGSSNPCNNPTFRPGDSPAHNVLTDTAPFPEGCDAACQAPWVTATGGKGDGGGDGTGDGTGDGDGGGDGTGTGDGTGDGAGAGTGDGTGGGTGCDPDTGLCGDGTGTGTTTGSSDVVATPTTLASQKTWGPTQLALVISVLFAGLLVLLPPLAARSLDARSPRPRKAAVQAPAGGPAVAGGPEAPAPPAQASGPRDPGDVGRVAP